MKKHAFLIIAHSSIEDLMICCQSIDARNHDIFIHIDKKWKKFSKKDYFDKIKYSNVTFLEHRYSVQWGGFSQILVEISLLKEAIKENYDYYHIISGVDMMIQPTDTFDAFFENKENEFISFCGEDWNKQAQNRLKYYYIEEGRNKLLKFINKIYLKTQKIFRVNRLKKLSDYKIVGGSNWCSITDEFANYIIEKEEWIKRVFKHSFCCDELFIHMLAYNSSFKNRIYLLKILDKNNDRDADMYKANMRLIDWNRGKPYTFTNDDFDEIICSSYLFARKFSLTSENRVSLRILEYLQSKNE